MDEQKNDSTEAQKAKVRNAILAMPEDQKRAALEVIPNEYLIQELTYRYNFLADFYIRITTETDAFKSDLSLEV